MFDDEVLEWVRGALHASHADERHDHEEAIRRLHQWTAVAPVGLDRI